MKQEILLANLRALLERMPDFGNYSPTSQEHLVWLGQGHALIQRWSPAEAMSLKVASNLMSNQLMRESTISNIMGIIHRAIADLELLVPDKGKVVFAAGEIYDFFKELNDLIGSAESTLLIVDPYLDHTIFDQYLVSVKPNVSVKLLINKNAQNVKSAAEKFASQNGINLEIRKTTNIHDRVIFIDNMSCWVVGQSLKDAAKAKPTYLSPLAPDVVSAKRQEYDSIWNESDGI